MSVYACPKPEPRKKKVRTPLKRSGRIARKAVVKKVNVKRKAKELLRAFGPPERREWMKEQMCLGCGAWGFSVSAHIENDGKNRRAAADKTIPLCCRSRGMPNACHQKFDAYETIGHDTRRPFKKGDEYVYGLAAGTEMRWQSYRASLPQTPNP